MMEKIRILFLSANPWTTSRILVDEEAREIFEKLQEGPDRNRFELLRHAATRPIDLQRLLLMHEPHIVHFSAHGSKKHKIILGGKPGRGKQVDRDGLVKMFALYKHHVRLIVLNACFTSTQARSLSEVIDYSVGAGKGIGDKEGVAFAGAFYRALGFGKSVKAAFESAKAELALTRMPRTTGLGLFVRDGVNENDLFPHAGSASATAVDQRRDVSDLFAEEFNDFERSEASSRRNKADLLPLDPMHLRKQVSRSALDSTRRVKLATLADPHSVSDEIKRRSSVSYLRAHMTCTFTVSKVVVSDSKRISQTRTERKDQTIPTRSRPAKRRLRRS